MLRHKPIFKYSGLTVILSNPSRLDKHRLLSANGGVFFGECLQPEYNMMMCDIRLTEDKSPFLDGTKCILLLGQRAMHDWIPSSKDNTLNEFRGSPQYVNNIPAVASYLPQDCVDLKNWEKEYNEQAQGYEDRDSDEWQEDSEEEGGDVKKFSNTKRSNYAFFLKRDLERVKKIVCSKEDICSWPIENAPRYIIFPSAQEVINILSNAKDCYLDFDMETDYEELNMLCFAFSVDGGKSIYSVPILNNDYRLAYGSSTYLIIRALVLSIKNNILVAHNGAGFDFIVLGMKYHIPVYRCFDTLIANRRIYPEIEASLGHCTSIWTYQQFHKDTDSRAYFTSEQMMQKLRYCAKDVFTMSLIRQRQLEYATTIPGLTDSINLANRSIRPYLTITLQGIRYDNKKVQEIVEENDKLMTQYNRIIEMLIGPIGMKCCHDSIKSKHKSFFALSNAQCANYFHEQLGYPVVARSEKTQKPSVGKNQLFKMALEHPDNPVLTYCNMFRQVQVETSKLHFHPWKLDDGTIPPKTKEIEI